MLSKRQGQHVPPSGPVGGMGAGMGMDISMSSSSVSPSSPPSYLWNTSSSRANILLISKRCPVFVVTCLFVSCFRTPVLTCFIVFPFCARDRLASVLHHSSLKPGIPSEYPIKAKRWPFLYQIPQHHKYHIPPYYSGPLASHVQVALMHVRHDQNGKG